MTKPDWPSHAAVVPAILVGLLAAAPPAAAQTSAACGASAPPVGAVVHGPVLQVIDAHTVCVALGPLPQQWLQMRLDARPAVRDGQAHDLFAQTVNCRVTAIQSGQVSAVCARVGGAPTAVQVSLAP